MEKSLNDLPDEICHAILCLLSLSDMISMERMSRRFHQLATDFWHQQKNLCFHLEEVSWQVIKSRLRLARKPSSLMFVANHNENSSLTELRSLLPCNPFVVFTPTSALRSQLTHLAFYDVCLTNKFLASIGVSFPQLTSFEFKLVLDKSPEFLKKTVRINGVDRKAPDYDQGISALIERCQNLTHFSLELDNIPEPSFLKKLKNQRLQSLKLKTKYLGLHDYVSLLSCVADCARHLVTLELVVLESLWMPCFWFVHTDPKQSLRNLWAVASNLNRIRLNFSTLSMGDALTSLRSFRGNRLSCVDLRGCIGLETGDLAAVASSCPLLVELNLADAQIESETSLGVLGTCHLLERIDVSRLMCRISGHIQPMSDLCFSQVFLIPNLRQVVADGCLGLTEWFFSIDLALGISGCQELQLLSFVDCPGLNDNALFAVVDEVHQMRRSSEFLQLRLRNEDQQVLEVASGVALHPFQGLWVKMTDDAICQLTIASENE